MLSNLDFTMESGNVHIQIYYFIFASIHVFILHTYTMAIYTHNTKFYYYVVYAHVYATDEAGDVNKRVRWNTHTGVKMKRG